MRDRTKKRKWGFILGFTLLLIPVCLLICFTMVELTLNESRFAYHQQVREKLFYMAEAGLEVAFNNYSVANFGAYTHTQSASTGALSTTTGFPVNSPSTGQTQFYPKSANPFTFAADSTGWYTWPQSSTGSYTFTNSGLAESIKFAVYQITYDATTNQSVKSDSSPQLSWDPIAKQYTQFRIDCIATLGTQSTQHSLIGYTTSPFQYAMFAAGDMGEFTRGSNQTITGDIRANGPLYLDPNATLTINADRVWSAGNIFRYTDDWGRTTNSGTVDINKNGYQSGGPTNLVTMTSGAQGTAFDSFNSNFHSPGSSGAANVFGTSSTTKDSVLMDGTMGVTALTPPKVQSLQPGGYYDTNSQIQLHNNGSQTGAYSGSTSVSGQSNWLATVTITNASEGSTVTAQQINVAALLQNTTALQYNSSTFPTAVSYTIYSDTPVQITNGEVLRAWNPAANGGSGGWSNQPVNLTIATNAPIYTVGSFNRADLNPDNGTSTWMISNINGTSVSAATTSPMTLYPPNSQAAMITADRIWNLSYNWNNNGSTAYPASPTAAQEVTLVNTASSWTGSKASSWTYSNIVSNINTTNGSSLPTTDPNFTNNQLQVNAAWVDGIYTVSEMNYATSTDPNTGLPRTNPSIPNDSTTPLSSASANATTDTYLERLTPITLTRIGSINHMQDATMAHYDNTGAGPTANSSGKTNLWSSYWYIKSNYSQPVRNYAYDVDFKTSQGTLWPLGGQKSFWMVVN